MQAIERQSGVAVWRQIADRIHAAVSDGAFDPAAPLPGEIALAERFGVNRHTVRAAIGALVEEGVLKREKGRGTFIMRARRLSYPIGPRTRLTDGLQGQVERHRMTLLESVRETADEDVAGALALPLGAPVLRTETVTHADDISLARATSWFDAKRFPRFDVAFVETGSVTAAFRIFGVDDYLRARTAVTATEVNAADRTHLKIRPGAIVLVARAINVDTAGVPIQFSITRFVADRVELDIKTPLPDPAG